MKREETRAVKHQQQHNHQSENDDDYEHDKIEGAVQISWYLASSTIRKTLGIFAPLFQVFTSFAFSIQTRIERTITNGRHFLHTFRDRV